MIISPDRKFDNAEKCSKLRKHFSFQVIFSGLQISDCRRSKSLTFECFLIRKQPSLFVTIFTWVGVMVLWRNDNVTWLDPKLKTLAIISISGKTFWWWVSWVGFMIVKSRGRSFLWRGTKSNEILGIQQSATRFVVFDFSLLATEKRPLITFMDWSQLKIVPSRNYRKMFIHLGIICQGCKGSNPRPQDDKVGVLPQA